MHAFWSSVQPNLRCHDKFLEWPEFPVAVHYDKLKETCLGFRHLAYSMINFGVTFTDS